ncbi:hypothetical protein [Amycolatopsis australiensis]|uniref:Uncharacterized protein n=1 Tax=Amycolatopsis australiensis TaxID=546364 RepID=A0A1K1S4E0_9PSEU|nr:hypothetical protein [Amycolatopsis australiensis]SFW79219.1 hypothetical protein SAMN04489730_4681 [Amycolatopsis australiensis]
MPTLTELPHWTIRTSGDEVTFVPVTARVRTGGGLALHEDDVPGFAKALGEVMKLPAYWHARARSTSREPVWSAPRHDEGFVRVAGPCRPEADRPGRSFTFALADVRELRVRIAAYLEGLPAR